jgi:DNA-binding YbaB/EbfC family protein
MANPFGKMGELIKMQRKMKKIQKDLRSTQIESTSPGGKVGVVINGEINVVSIDIDESVLAPDRKGELESALKETINAGVKKAQLEAAEKTKGVLGDLNLPI